MTKLQGLLLAGISIGLTLSVGCNSTPGVSSGMSEMDAKDAIAKMSPQDKIKAIASSPMPQKEKDAEYAKIESETGVKAADVLGGSTASGPPGGH